MGALLLGAAVLLLIAWRLLRGYFRDKWSGYSQPSLWQLPWAAVSATAGGGMLWLLWRDLEHTATRMGVGVAVLVILILSEARSISRRPGDRWTRRQRRSRHVEVTSVVREDSGRSAGYGRTHLPLTGDSPSGAPGSWCHAVVAKKVTVCVRPRELPRDHAFT